MIVTDIGKAYGWGLNTRPLKLGNIILENSFLETIEFELPGKKIGNSFLFKAHCD